MLKLSLNIEYFVIYKIALKFKAKIINLLNKITIKIKYLNYADIFLS